MIEAWSLEKCFLTLFCNFSYLFICLLFHTSNSFGIIDRGYFLPKPSPSPPTTPLGHIGLKRPCRIDRVKMVYSNKLWWHLLYIFFVFRETFFQVAWWVMWQSLCFCFLLKQMIYGEQRLRNKKSSQNDNCLIFIVNSFKA